MKLYCILLQITFTCTHSMAQTNLPIAKHPFIVIAHRGDHVAAPENTIAAFENAILHQVDFAEIGLRTTKDSVLLIMHDATVDRTTNGKGKVSDLTLAEIKQLKIIDSRNANTGKTYLVPTLKKYCKPAKTKSTSTLTLKMLMYSRLITWLKNTAWSSR